MPTPQIPDKNEAKDILGDSPDLLAESFIAAHARALAFFSDKGRRIDFQLLPQLVRHEYLQELEILQAKIGATLKRPISLSVAFTLRDFNIRLYKRKIGKPQRRRGASPAKVRLIEQEAMRLRMEQPELDMDQMPSHAGTALEMFYAEARDGSLHSFGFAAYDGFEDESPEYPNNPAGKLAWEMVVDLDAVIARAAGRFESDLSATTDADLDTIVVEMQDEDDSANGTESGS